MSDTPHIITLGAAQLPVAALPLGKLRKVLPAFNRIGAAFAAGMVTETVLDEVFTLLALATGLPVAQLEEMPGTYPQLLAAVATVADVCGLQPRETPAGNVVPGMTPSPA